MIFSETMLTTCIANFIFKGRCVSNKNWLVLKIVPPNATLACLNWWNTLYLHQQTHMVVTPTSTPTSWAFPHALCLFHAYLLIVLNYNISWNTRFKPHTGLLDSPHNNVICFTDLIPGSERIIFKSLLTTFIASVTLEVSGALVKIGSSLKSNHLNQI